MLANVLIMALCLCAAAFLLPKIKSANAEFEARRRDFVAYLYEINDTGTLADIGETGSPFGTKDRWRYTGMYETVLDRFLQNKDKKFLEFYDSYKLYRKKILLPLIASMLCAAAFLDRANALFGGGAAGIAAILLVFFAGLAGLIAYFRGTR